MINIAIIGTGSIASTHLEAFARFRDRCRIMALVDRSGGKAAKLKERFGLDCTIYSDYKEVLLRIGGFSIDLYTAVNSRRHCFGFSACGQACTGGKADGSIIVRM